MYNQFRPGGFQILPPVVKNLLIINGLFFLASMVVLEKFNIQLVQYLGLFYFDSPFFRPWQFVTHIFMHGSWMHIFSNMLSLWMFGSVLENVWGPKRFLTYYIITALGAAFLHTAIQGYGIYQTKERIEAYQAAPSFQGFLQLHDKENAAYYEAEVMSFMQEWSQDKDNPLYVEASKEWSEIYVKAQNMIPTVGASGAVFGVLLAFGMLFPNTFVYLYFAIPVKAKYFVILYGGLELYLGLANDPGDNVAHFAHLGGMLFGFFLIKYWNKKQRNSFY